MTGEGDMGIALDRVTAALRAGRPIRASGPTTSAPDPGRVVMADVEATREVRFSCHACGATVHDGDGWITVDVTAAANLSRAYERFDDLCRLGVALPTLPPPASWHCYHIGCDRDQCHEHAYWFAVERARTVGQLLEWGSRLGRKWWIDGTDWTAFLLWHGFGLEFVP
jgi:hypothetical protein